MEAWSWSAKIPVEFEVPKISNFLSIGLISLLYAGSTYLRCGESEYIDLVTQFNLWAEIACSFLEGGVLVKVEG